MRPSKNANVSSYHNITQLNILTIAIRIHLLGVNLSCEISTVGVEVEYSGRLDLVRARETNNFIAPLRWHAATNICNRGMEGSREWLRYTAGEQKSRYCAGYASYLFYWEFNSNYRTITLWYHGKRF
jgi:hypothetical protein